jgi:P-type Cu2+ transporter
VRLGAGDARGASGSERLAEVDCIVFDKTGTLTLGEADLASDLPEPLLVTAAAVARFSRHPLSKALVRAAGGRLLPTATAVSEHPGLGLEAQVDGQTVRLGAADWVGVPQRFVDGPHLWLRVGDGPAVLVRFQDSIRGDAVDVVRQLLARGLQLHLLSGDSAGPVAVVAEQLGLPASHAHARVTPADKARLLDTLRAQGRKTLMVGDGLNDGPALRAAHVSMAPASGADIAQGAADLVFQGDKLAPVLSALAMGRSSQRLAVENFILAIGYNVIAVPLAVAGMVTPLIAAIAMSTSSILVVLNALRLNLPQGDR